jgi:glycosyltransferase involved in cell wall biosynthesis
VVSALYNTFARLPPTCNLAKKGTNATKTPTPTAPTIAWEEASVKFSVVTISYNQVRFLERAILSVLTQKGVEFEYIIVDPGSTDGSREIIERYRNAFAHLIFEKDYGPADGLNKALARVSGDFFVYINSDDELLPDALSKMAAALSKDPRLDVVYSNGRVLDADGNFVRRVYSARRFTPALYARGLAVIVQQASCLRTAMLRTVGGFNKDNRTSWDGEAFLDIALAGGRFTRIWDDWGVFRIYPGSISGSGRLNKAYQLDCARMFRKTFGRPAELRDGLATTALYILTRLTDLRRLYHSALSLFGRS